MENTIIKTNGQTWFKLAIATGAGLALLLLANSISTYDFVSKRIIFEQTRRDIAKVVTGFDKAMREPGAAQPAGLMDEARNQNGGRVAWMELRDFEGHTLARAGTPASPTFSTSELRTRFQSRQPAVKTRILEAGELVVEAMPVRLPGNKPGLVEVAMQPREADDSLWPIRRSLIIQSSAAIALLAALLLIALRFRAYVRGRHLAEQIELAREVQRNLLPATSTIAGGPEVAAAYAPASDVSGDFYDVQQLPDGGYSIVLGDVSGKGLPAALLMGVIHGAVRSANWMDSRRHHEEATRRLNQLLCERAGRERFATMFWGYYDPHTTLLHYINAGHFAPMLLTAEGKLTRLEEGGPVLGVLASAPYRQGTVRIRANDLLVLFTDGILEAANEEGEEFGEDRVAAVVRANAAESPERIRLTLLESVRAFTGSQALADDQTVVILRHQHAAIVEPVAGLVA